VLGEPGVEELLTKTIKVAVHTGAVKPSDLQRVIVDTTMQRKAVACLSRNELAQYHFK
jgi:IS5 family transposase